MFVGQHCTFHISLCRVYDICLHSANGMNPFGTLIVVPHEHPWSRCSRFPLDRSSDNVEPDAWSINRQPGKNPTEPHGPKCFPEEPYPIGKAAIRYMKAVVTWHFKARIAPKAVFREPAREERTNAERRRFPGPTATNRISSNEF